MANRPPCKHLDHDFDPRHDACLKCGMTREKWRALDVATVAVSQECTCPAKDMPFGSCCKASQPDERAAFEAWFYEQLQSGRNLPKADMWDAWQASATAPQATPIYQIGSPVAGGIAWWDVTQERYEAEKKAGYMKTCIVYREGE